MDTAANPFKDLRGSGWKPSLEMADPNRYPIEIKVPDGLITVEGTRRNSRMVIEYLEGWLDGRGAKGIDSLAGKGSAQPALMEDLATGRMSVAQIAQRIIHYAEDSNTGQKHDFFLVKKLLINELDDILFKLNQNASDTEELSKAEVRYRKALKIAMRWIKNYTELDFRSLGSYTREDLEKISEEEDSF